MPGRDLQLRPENLPVRTDRARTDAVLARATALIERRAALAQTPAPPPPAPPVEIVLVPAACATFGTPFLVVAERRQDNLLIVASRAAPQGAAAARTAPLAGQYRVTTAPGWSCPCCKHADPMPVWVCSCPSYHGAIHCGGTADGAPDGARHCACGRLEQRAFTTPELLTVSGRSLASRPVTRTLQLRQG